METNISRKEFEEKELENLYGKLSNPATSIISDVFTNMPHLRDKIRKQFLARSDLTDGDIINILTDIDRASKIEAGRIILKRPLTESQISRIIVIIPELSQEIIGKLDEISVKGNGFYLDSITPEMVRDDELWSAIQNKIEEAKRNQKILDDMTRIVLQFYK